MLARAPTSESTAVRVTVTTRTLRVGCTRLNESKALSRVSDPPYMFSAITESSPRAEKTRMIAPKPLKTWSPDFCSSGMPVPEKALPAHAARAAPMLMIQTAPSPEPPYVQ